MQLHIEGEIAWLVLTADAKDFRQFNAKQSYRENTCFLEPAPASPLNTRRSHIHHHSIGPSQD
jgi:hypothetical protein